MLQTIPHTCLSEPVAHPLPGNPIFCPFAAHLLVEADAPSRATTCRDEGSVRGGERAVMSMHKLTAGDGYRYLTRHVAAGDAGLVAGDSLTAYYEQTGNPPGRWHGTGLAGLGTDAIARLVPGCLLYTSPSPRDRTRS